MSYKQTDLMLDIILLIEHRWVGADQVELVADKMSISDIKQKISLFRELKRLISLLPTEVFNDLEQRQNLIAAIQEAQDLAIDDEEDEISGMGE